MGSVLDASWEVSPQFFEETFWRFEGKTIFEYQINLYFLLSSVSTGTMQTLCSLYLAFCLQTAVN